MTCPKCEVNTASLCDTGCRCIWRQKSPERLARETLLALVERAKRRQALTDIADLLPLITGAWLTLRRCLQGRRQAHVREVEQEAASRAVLALCDTWRAGVEADTWHAALKAVELAAVRSALMWGEP